MADQVPPHSLECEQAVLGCVLLDPQRAMMELADRLAGDSEAFYDLRHKHIFEVMCDLYRAALPVNTVTVWQKLKDQQAKVDVAYVNSLPDAATSAVDVAYYADQIEEKAALRKLIRVCAEATAKAYGSGLDVETVIAEAERGILAVRKQKQDKTPPVRTIVKQALSEIERLWEEKGVVSGVPTGYGDLDSLTDGLHPSEMIVVAGYPGAGKSALAVNIAEHVAISQKHPVGIFSLEMSAMRLVFRMLASRGRVNLKAVKKGSLEQGDFPKILHAGKAIADSPFHFCDMSDLTIFQLRAKARQMYQAHKIKLLVVDYLQLLTAPGKKEQSREQEVATISRGLKMMACELGIPVLALSQLNDDGKLRESRAIGQDADGIWVLQMKDGQDPESDPLVMVLNIRKQRDGQAPAKVELIFQKSNVRFEGAAKIGPDDHKF